MSRSVREITAELIASGLNADQLALVTELAVAAVADASGGRSKHAIAQANYLKRKGSGVITNDHNDHTDHSDHIPPIDKTTPPSSKPKRVSRSVAIDVPETPSEGQKAFAAGKGWDLAKTLSEWVRFKDWSLNKGRKHRNLDAAWRNWVTSPYQVSGASNGRPVQADKSVVAAADRILERMRSFDRPLEENRRGDGGFTGQNPRRLLSQG